LAEVDNPETATIRNLASKNGEHVAKPGWARVNFNYFIEEAEAQFIRDAVLQIASDGWRLLPFYKISPLSGQFHFRAFERLDTLRSLAELQFDDVACRYRIPCQDVSPLDHSKVLSDAKLLYQQATSLVVEVGDGGFAPDENYEVAPTDALLQSEWWLTPSASASQIRRQEASMATMPLKRQLLERDTIAASEELRCIATGVLSLHQEASDVRASSIHQQVRFNVDSPKAHESVDVSEVDLRCLSFSSRDPGSDAQRSMSLQASKNSLLSGIMRPRG